MKILDIRYIAIRFITLTLATVFLAGCTQTYQDIYSTANELAFGFNDANQSAQEILDLPYASANIRIGDGAELFVVLALVEPSSQHTDQNQLKWVSSDSSMLVTENGRLVKTLRLPIDNLAGLTHQNGADPLSLLGEKPQQQTWQTVYDWQPGYRYNFDATIDWYFVEQQTIQSAVWTKKTNYYQEVVYIPSLDASFTNHFWLDAVSHQVVKSIQVIGPDMFSIDMTILKPYAG
ncbi:YjbF family lipoprotein [Vibrio sp. TH_r3]|uniref:YjbF family lipoprotein n=1 Tax=Vibrio sp. TH_r3 TaxID=3082084 RepID=UPI00295586FC|nr:YjbF family lipoprotein [Vibrio sp. TH_r3]MDV7105987.1 YjbF family lipoprotein [Vibrio sp. TH_r3]